MDANVDNYNFAFTDVKSEPTEFATLIPKPQSYGCSHVEMDRENAESAVTIKNASTTSAKVGLNISNIGTASNVNFKLNLSCENLLNSSCSNREPKKEDASESDLKISTMLHLHEKSLARPIDNELKCDVYAKNCTMSSRNFKTRKNILKHMQLHAKEKMLKCEIPSATFRRNEANNKYQMYTKCFKRKGEALKHKKHNNERKFACEMCMKCFTTKQHLSDHVKIHTGERNYKCEACTKCFVTKGHLSSHSKTHTGERNYRCEICSKCFITNGDLLKHMIVHSDERSYKCETCTKCFVTKGRLSSHVKTHTGDGNYACEICTKRLITKQSLANHVKIHTGERNYGCEVCAKRFITKQKLSNHVTTHTGERDFKCEDCGKCFVTKWHLSNHVKIHTGEKDFACEVCAKRFAIKQNLLAHVKIHSREGKYRCEVCAKRFVTKRNLSKHLKMHVGKRNSFSEYKKTHCGEKRVRKIVGEIEKVFIKEENDIAERKPPTGTNEDRTDAITMEEKTEIFDLWQTFNSEIVVKEEENMTTT